MILGDFKATVKRSRAEMPVSFPGLQYGDLLRDPHFISHRIRMRGHFEWTPEAIASAVALWTNGLNKPKIAAHFGVTKSAVAAMISSHRSLFPHRPPAPYSAKNPHVCFWKTSDGLRTLSKAGALWLENFSVAEMARRLSLKKNQMSGIVHRNRDLFPGRPSPIKRGAPIK